MTNLEWALEYYKLGLHVIPVSKDKKPYVNWKTFQTIGPTEEQINAWFMQWPDANVGVITGEVTGITMVDVDSKSELAYVKNLVPKTVPRFTTGRGGQYMFKWNGERNTVKVNGREIDVRGEGGFSVFPESIHENGSVYKWVVPFVRSNLTEVPVELRTSTPESKPVYAMTFSEGTRDNDLYHVAVQLRKGGMPKDEAKAVIVKQAMACDPPVDEKTAILKVESAYRGENNHSSADIMDVLEHDAGTRFSALEISQMLGISVNGIYAQLKRLADKGKILKDGKRYYVPGRAIEVDPFTISAKAFNIQFPFGIHDFARIAQGDVVLVAGTKNSGKSSILAETALCNMRQTHINYIFTENVRKIGERFVKWGFTQYDIMSRMRFIDARSRNYDSVIAPDDLNILDYYNPSEGEYNRVAIDIENMARKLDTGVLVMGIQQREDQDFARGGALSEELAQLVIQLKREDKSGENRINRATLKMIKEEGSRHGGEGKSVQYTFSSHASGSRPKMVGEWEWESKKRLKKAGIPDIGGTLDNTQGEREGQMRELRESDQDWLIPE